MKLSVYAMMILVIGSLSQSALAAAVCSSQCVAYTQVWGPGLDELHMLGNVTETADTYTAAFKAMNAQCDSLFAQFIQGYTDTSRWQKFMVKEVDFNGNPETRAFKATFADISNSCISE